MKSFVLTQKAFVENLRDPVNKPFDYGIEPRRMDIYRELFFNNILGFLNSGFPVLKSLYSEHDWRALARQFFAEHRCRSPYFIDISKEFVEFLSNEYENTEADPEFLQELAHYEWIELAISIKKTEKSLGPWDQNTPISGLALSELAVLLSYHYPVHQISLDYQPSALAEPIYLVVFRNHLHKVNFSLVNATSAHLLNYISRSNQATIDEIELQMIEALPQLDGAQVAKFTRDTVFQFLQQQILVPVKD